MSTLLIILVVLVIGYALLSMKLYLSQSKHLYFPTRVTGTSPTEHGFPYEDIWIKTSDHYNIHGWYVPVKNATYTVLFLHGNTGNISDCIDSIRIFSTLGLNTFLFDYRGYGQSEGEPTENGTYLDAEAAWNYIVNELGVSPENIIILGRSLGAAVSSWLARKHQPGMLIIESTFTSLPDIAAESYPLFPSRYLTRFKYPVEDNVKHIHCPTLIVHSAEDEVIGMHHGKKLFKAANQPKSFLEISGPHNQGFLSSGQQYIDGINHFISKY